MVTVTIDHQTIAVKDGSTIMEAAKTGSHRDPASLLSEGDQRYRRLPCLRGGAGRKGQAGHRLQHGRCRRHGRLHQLPKSALDPQMQCGSCCFPSMTVSVPTVHAAATVSCRRSATTWASASVAIREKGNLYSMEQRLPADPGKQQMHQVHALHPDLR